MTDPPSELGAEWKDLLGKPRHRNAELTRGEIPREPGVYGWFRDGQCVYVGKASNLRQRLSSHRATKPDLSRSTLRASVAVELLGVTRAVARSRPSGMTADQIVIVNTWFQQVEVAWVECATVGEAASLEHRLRREWLPSLNRM